MPFQPIKLNNGHLIPSIAFGTASLPSPSPSPSPAGPIQTALEVGFAHLDTAQVYHSESSIGQTLKESGLAREDVYITTKWAGMYGDEKDQDVGEALENSLRRLGVEWVDMYLIHAPEVIGGGQEGVGEVWRRMEGLVRGGKARSIGVSNFELPDLEALLPYTTIKPAINQIPFYPYIYTTHLPLLKYMQTHSITLAGYSPLATITHFPGGPVDAVVRDIAKRMGKREEQVLLAWAKAKGAVIVTTSSKRERLEGYLDVGEFDLSADDVEAIDRAGKKGYPTVLRSIRSMRSMAGWAGTAIKGLVLVGAGLYLLSEFPKITF